MPNIHDDIPEELPEELTTPLFNGRGFRVVRIVSRGHSSPPGFWYQQSEHEWVLLLSGSAVIEYEGDAPAVRLGKGDHLNIPAGVKHRVARTDPGEPTVWLAVFHS